MTVDGVFRFAKGLFVGFSCLVVLASRGLDRGLVLFASFDFDRFFGFVGGDAGGVFFVQELLDVADVLLETCGRHLVDKLGHVAQEVPVV